MYGSTTLSTLLGATPGPITDLEGARSYGRALIKHGLPVLLVEPDGKRPADWRSTTEKNKDQATDVRGGVHLATTKTTTLDKYLKRAYAQDPKRGHPAPLQSHQTLNWAVRLRGSGYVVADADTPGEVAALEHFISSAYPGSRPPAPTVVTPGTSNGAHHGGGHWWFKLPEELAEAMEHAVGLSATVKVPVPGFDEPFSLYMGDAFVLIPPSARNDGQYRMVAPDTDLPAPLEAVIRERLDMAESRQELRREREESLEAGEWDMDDLDTQITHWAMSHPWTEILQPHGWEDTGMPDSCGCRVWTAPGPHGSPKSATTHSDVCSAGRYDLHNAPMHIWTDNPGPELESAVNRYGTKTLSKLRVWAALNFNGDEGAAMADAGISTSQGTPLDVAATVAGAGTVQDAARVSGATSPADVMESIINPAPVPAPVPEGQPVPFDNVVDADLETLPTTIWGGDIYKSLEVKAGRPSDDDPMFRAYRVGPASLFDDLEPPTWLVADMLEHGLCSIVGDSGVGKSVVVLDLLCHMAMGWPWRGKKTRQCSSLYIAGESIHGALDRLHTWARVHEAPEVLDRVWVMQGTPQLSGDPVYLGKVEEAVLRGGLEVVVFDTLARATVGLEENAAKDMGVVNGVFDRIMRDTGASLWYVHHLTRGTQHGRGSTALYGAVDSEIIITDLAHDGDIWDQKMGSPVAYKSDGTVVELAGKPVTVQVNKQKNGADTGDGTWVEGLLSSVDSPDDDRQHVILTELDGQPSHVIGNGQPLQSRKPQSGSTERREVDESTLPDVGMARDQAVVERLADMVEYAVDNAMAQDARFSRGDLERTTAFKELRVLLSRQGWTYSWPEHVQHGMDLAVQRSTNHVGRPTKATVGYVDQDEY